MWKNSHRISTQHWQKTSYKTNKKDLIHPKLQEWSPCNRVGWVKKKRNREGQDLCSWPWAMKEQPPQSGNPLHLLRWAGTDSELYRLRGEYSNQPAGDRAGRDQRRRSWPPPCTPHPKMHIWAATEVTKVCLVKATVFPVVMYGCDSWTIKKAEHRRIDVFELWCWRRLLRVPWTARRYNQSILKEISPEYSLEGLIWNWNSNTLATWWEELTHWKRPWSWERLKAGGERDDRGWDGWMASPTQWTWAWVDSGNQWWTGRPGVLQSMGSQTVRHNWATELNWGTTLNVLQK